MSVDKQSELRPHVGAFAGRYLYVSHALAAMAARDMLGQRAREPNEFITTELAPCTKPGRELPGGWIWESFAAAADRVRRAS